MLSAFGVGIGVLFQSTGRLFVLLAGGYRIGVLAASIPEALIFARIKVAIWQGSIWLLMLMSIVHARSIRGRRASRASRARPDRMA